jgi:hypothetical protein
MSLLDMVFTKLQQDGVFDGTVWKCYKNFIPDDQDQAIALYETGGFPADTLARENESPTFQVAVRAKRFDYTACRNKWQEVFDSLQDAQQDYAGDPSDPLPGIYLMQAMATGPLAMVDEKQRPLLTVNFRVIKERS